MTCCICDIVCSCNTDAIAPSHSIEDRSPATAYGASIGACLLGKTRPVVSSIATADQLNLFNISNEYKTYSYTLSPKGVGIMAAKSRDKQYETLKRLHKEVLDTFECSYIINIEIYPNSDNDIHCHGMIRFRSHNKKEEFKKLLKDKLTLYKKGTYPNLIDCEFVNKFDKWNEYIMKSQEVLIQQTNYYPFIKIDYSFHIISDAVNMICVPVSLKTYKRKIKDPEAYKKKLELQEKAMMMKLEKLRTQILSL